MLRLVIVLERTQYLEKLGYCYRCWVEGPHFAQRQAVVYLSVVISRTWETKLTQLVSDVSCSSGSYSPASQPPTCGADIRRPPWRLRWPTQP